MHVLDLSGRLDSEGHAIGDQGVGVEKDKDEKTKSKKDKKEQFCIDLAFVSKELHQWVFSNV